MLPHMHRVQLRPKRTEGLAREGNFLRHDPAYTEFSQRLKSAERRQKQTAVDFELFNGLTDERLCFFYSGESTGVSS